MKKTLILMAAAASVVLTGCTENDLSGDTSLAKESAPSAIEFSAKTRNAGTTRAGAVGAIAAADPKTAVQVLANKGGFGVFAFNTAASDWSTAKTTATPNFMYNQLVSGTDAVAPVWTYTPIKYWPNGKDTANEPNGPSNTAVESSVQKLSFFAYAPHVSLTDVALSGVGITKVNGRATKGGAASEGNQKQGDPTVEYTLSTTDLHTAANVDLLWGLRGDATYSETDGGNNTGTVGTDYNVDLTKQTVGEKVTFLFKHALAKIGGKNGLKIVADIDGNGEGLDGYGELDSKTCITVRSITIKNKGSEDFKVSGIFDLATGTWSDLTNAASQPTNGALINENIKDGADDSDANTVDIAMNTDIYLASGEPIYSSSVWTPLGVTTTAKDVYNTDGQDAIYLIPGSSVTLTVAINYDITTYDENINGNYVKINQTITNDVTVSIPNNATNKFYTLVLHLGLTSVKFSAEVADWDNAEADAVEEVWLPSNVVDASTEVTLVAGNNATVNVAADQTPYTINLTGLKVSEAVSETHNGVIGTVTGLTADASGNAAISVPLTANASDSQTVSSTITIKGKDSSDSDFTTVVTIIQAKAQ